MDCPICMDAIVGTTNMVTTECGHTFHTNCLMSSVSHNGFGCPLCRAKMAEEREEEEDEDDYSYDSDDYASSDDEDSWDDLIDEDYVLRGFRLMFRQNNVIETDEEYEREDAEDEESDEIDINRYGMASNNVNENIPSREYIQDKLINLNIEYSDLLSSLLNQHREYHRNYNIESIVHFNIRRIIQSYQRERENETPSPGNECNNKDDTNHNETNTPPAMDQVLNLIIV